LTLKLLSNCTSNNMLIIDEDQNMYSHQTDNTPHLLVQSIPVLNGMSTRHSVREISYNLTVIVCKAGT